MLLSLFFAISVALGSTDTVYSELKKASIKSYSEKTLTVRGQNISYSSYILDGPLLTSGYISESIRVSSEISIDKIRSTFEVSCDKNKDLEIYQVNFDILNTPNLITSEKKFLGLMWGFFDPRRGNTEKTAILIATHTINSNHVIIAHEVAHYWYERYCISSSSISSEDFAKIVESSYFQHFNVVE